MFGAVCFWSLLCISTSKWVLCYQFPSQNTTDVVWFLGPDNKLDPGEDWTRDLSFSSYPLCHLSYRASVVIYWYSLLNLLSLLQSLPISSFCEKLFAIFQNNFIMHAHIMKLFNASHLTIIIRPFVHFLDAKLNFHLTVSYCKSKSMPIEVNTSK